MKVKLKILLGFLTLVFTLAIAAGYSIIEFSKISSSVSSLLDDNYTTINAASNMLEAIEKIDNGILLLQMGDFDEGRKNIRLADSLFKVEYNVALHNLTEVNEDQYLTRISREYKKLGELIKYPIVGTIKEGDLKWYHSEFHPLFLQLKSSINDLLELNQNSMHKEAVILKEKSKRAIMPAIVTIIASIVFTLIFSTLINYYYISPLQRIIKKVKGQNSPSRYKVEENAIDEIKELDEGLKELISGIRLQK